MKIIGIFAIIQNCRQKFYVVERTRMSNKYLKSYLEKDSLANAIYKREIGDFMLLRKLASMTDKELGKWITEKERPKEELIDAISCVDEKRLALALSFTDEERMASILNNASLDLLIVYDEVDEGWFDRLPQEFEKLSYDGIANRIGKLYSRQQYDTVARTIVVLYRRNVLSKLLKNELLSCEDVAKLVVGFYTDIFYD